LESVHAQYLVEIETVLGKKSHPLVSFQWDKFRIIQQLAVLKLKCSERVGRGPCSPAPRQSRALINNGF
jgi:hypothetical protein